MATIDILINAKNNASAAIDDVNQALSKLDKNANGVDKAFGNLQKTITVGVVGAMAAVGTAIAGAGVAMVKGVRQAADLEQQLANIASVTGSTMEQMQPFKDLITDLAVDPNLKVTTTEAADAIEMLARNGLSMDEILQGATKSTVLLANATGAEFGMAADIATDVMALFNINASEMSSAVNGITSVVTGSKFSIEDYAFAIAQGGGVAASVGVDFQDFNTTIAAISPFFSSGSDAGTSFKTMLQRLVPASDEAVNVMRDLGLYTGLTEKEIGKAQDKIKKYNDELISLDPTSKNFSKRSSELTQKIETLASSIQVGQNAFFTAEGEMRSMAEISGVLQNALSGLSEEQKNNAVSTIFGTDAMRAAFALAEIGEGQFRQLAESMSLTDAVEASSTRMDTFAGTMEILGGIVESIQIQIGTAFMPILRRLAVILIGLAEKHGPAVVSAFESFADILGMLFDYIENVRKEGRLLTLHIDSLPKSINMAIRRFLEFQNTLSNFVRPIIESISRFVTLQDVLGAVGIVIASILIPALGSIVMAAAPVILLFGALVLAVSRMRALWDTNFNGIRDVVQRVIDVISSRFGGLIDGSTSLSDAISDAFGAILTYVTDNLPSWITKLGEWGSALVSWISDNIEPAKTKLSEWYTALSGWLTANLPTWITALSAWGSAIWGFIVSAIEPTKTKLGEWYNAAVDWLGENLPNWTIALLQWSTELVDWIGDAAPKAIDALGDFILEIIGYGDSDIVPELEKQGERFGTALIDWVNTVLIPEVAPEFEKFQTELTETIDEIVLAITETAAKLGPPLYEWLTVDALPKVIENMETLRNTVIGDLRTMDEDGNIYAGALANHMERISGAIETLGTWITSLIEWWQGLNPDTAQAVVEFGLLAGTLRVVWPLVSTLSEWLGVTGLLGAIGSVVSAIAGAAGSSALIPVLTALSSPIGLAAAAVAALALTWTTNFLDIRDHTLAMVDAIGTGWSEITENLSLWWEDAHAKIGETLSTSSASISENWTTFTTNLSNGWHTLTSDAGAWWSTMMEGFKTQLDNSKSGIETSAQAIWTAVTSAISNTTERISSVKSWATNLLDNYKDGLATSTSMDALRTNATAIWTAITDRISNTTARISSVKSWATNLLDNYKDGLATSTSMDALRTNATAIWTAITDRISNTTARISSVKSWATNLLDNYKDGLATSTSMDALRTNATAIWTAITDRISNTTARISSVKSWATNLLDNYKDGLATSTSMDALRTNATAIWTAITDRISNTTARISSVKSWATNLLDNYKDGLATSTSMDALRTNATAIWTAITDRISNTTARISDVKSWATNLLDNYKDGLATSTSMDALRTNAQAIWNAIYWRIGNRTELVTSVLGWAESVLNNYKDGLATSTSMDALRTNAQAIWTTITDRISNTTARISDVKSWATNLLDNYKDGLATSTSMSSLRTNATAIWTTITDRISNTTARISDVKSWATNLLDNYKDGLATSTSMDALRTNAQSIWDAIYWRIGNRTELVTSVLGWAESVLNNYKDGLATSTSMDALRTNATAIWTTITDRISNTTARISDVKSWATNLLDNYKDGLATSTSMDALRTNAQSIWDAIYWRIGSRTGLMNQIKNWAHQLFDNFNSGISEKVTNVREKAQEVWNTLTGMFSVESLKQIGRNLMQGFSDGMIERLNFLKSSGQTLHQMFNDFLAWIRYFFRMSSPSRVMEDMGVNLMVGMALGMVNGLPDVINAAQLMANSVMGVASGMTLSPNMAMSASTIAAQRMSGNVIQPSNVTNSATYNLNYQTMQSAGSVQQDIELLNLLYGGQL